MARLLMKALEVGGFSPLLASELRTLARRGDAEEQQEIKRASDDEAARLIASFGALPTPERPQLWFTYHVYYKAPDWIGPAVARSLGIPYVVAEGSRAAKRADGPWSLGHRGAEEALDYADVLFVMTDKDREALAAARRDGQSLVSLPPFLDEAEWAPLSPPPARRNAVPKLLCVAMMRDGDKRESYRLLADALTSLRDLPWSLDIVGDGEARASIEALFAPLGERIVFHGAIEDRAALRTMYEQADLFVWPAVNEAYGMVFLEAQLLGCPVVAGAFGGVASVVEDGRTGLLVRPSDSAAFAAAVGGLLHGASRRAMLGENAHRFVAGDRGLARAAVRLREGLEPVLARKDTSPCAS